VNTTVENELKVNVADMFWLHAGQLLWFVALNDSQNLLGRQLLGNNLLG